MENFAVGKVFDRVCTVSDLHQIPMTGLHPHFPTSN